MKSPSKKAPEDEKKDVHNLTEKDPKSNLALVSAKPVLREADIKLAYSEITNDNVAKLIGLVAHLAYWSVFGHINPLPLDKYHLK